MTPDQVLLIFWYLITRNCRGCLLLEGQPGSAASAASLARFGTGALFIASVYAMFQSTQTLLLFQTVPQLQAHQVLPGMRQDTAAEPPWASFCPKCGASSRDGQRPPNPALSDRRHAGATGRAAARFRRPLSARSLDVSRQGARGSTLRLVLRIINGAVRHLGACARPLRTTRPSEATWPRPIRVDQTERIRADPESDNQPRVLHVVLVLCAERTIAYPPDRSRAYPDLDVAPCGDSGDDRDVRKASIV
jgi:hypothetical protein